MAEAAAVVSAAALAMGIPEAREALAAGIPEAREALAADIPEAREASAGPPQAGA
jgi:hypothetical protein